MSVYIGTSLLLLAYRDVFRWVILFRITIVISANNYSYTK